MFDNINQKKKNTSKISSTVHVWKIDTQIGKIYKMIIL